MNFCKDGSSAICKSLARPPEHCQKTCELWLRKSSGTELLVCRAGTLGLLYRLKGPLWLSDITLVTTPARRQTLDQSQVQQLDEAIRRNLDELGFWNKILLNILLESLNKPGLYLTKQK